MVATWTLVLFLVGGGSSITVEGFRSLAGCSDAGEEYRTFVDERAQFECRPVG